MAKKKNKKLRKENIPAVSIFTLGPFLPLEPPPPPSLEYADPINGKYEKSIETGSWGGPHWE